MTALSSAADRGNPLLLQGIDAFDTSKELELLPEPAPAAGASIHAWRLIEVHYILPEFRAPDNGQMPKSWKANQCRRRSPLVPLSVVGCCSACYGCYVCSCCCQLA